VKPPRPDDWLIPFLARLREAGPRVLELGCGPGLDAATLAAAGFEVVALDRWRPGWAAAPQTASFVRGDIRHIPARAGAFDAVVASLSLHYLPWAETVGAFAGAGACLRPGGRLLFRVNASDDYHHGAGEGEEVEPGYFRVAGEHGQWSETKRFFMEADVRRALPDGFTIEHLAHVTILRYQNPKRAWECLARKG
jgi:SAM-dependent methyltransferase